MNYQIDTKQLILGIIFLLKSIPQIFFLMAMPVILRIEGHSLIEIGLLQLAGLPFILKFLWAPYFDINSYQKNHYKKSLAIGGIVYILLIASIALFNIKTELSQIAVLIFITSIVVTFLDLSINGLYIKLLQFNERGLGSSIKVTSGYLSAIIGEGVLLLFYDDLGWKYTVLVMVGFLILGLFTLVFLKEPEYKEDTQIKREKFPLKVIYTFFQKQGMKTWFFIIIVKSLSAWSLIYMIKPMMVDQGVDTKLIASITGFFGVFVAASVAFLSSFAFIQNYILKRKKFLLFSLYLSSIGVFQAILLLTLEVNLYLLYYVVGFLHIATTLSAVISSTLMIDFSRKGSESTDYSLQMGTAYLGPTLVSGISGFIILQVEYIGFVIFLSIISILAILLTHKLFKQEWIQK